jgi:hypothetical protein
MRNHGVAVPLTAARTIPCMFARGAVVARDIDKEIRPAPETTAGVKRRRLLRFGTLIAAFTGASAISALNTNSAHAAVGDTNPSMDYVPIAQKGVASGVATLDPEAKIPTTQLPDLSTSYATHAAMASGLVQKVAKGEIVLNVTDYGATGNGTTDDSAAIQAAIVAAPAGATVFIPAGNYLCRRIVGTGKSNVTIYGVRGASILLYNRTGSGPVDPIIGWNLSANPATNDRNITIRDLTFKGSGTRSENQALLHMSAIDGLTVNNCEFLNMQGDAINIARTGAGGADTGVRNRNVRITNNLFDGVNYAGRNGVTIIAGEGILIQGNTFTRLASPSMPGAIDVEPNVFDTTAICSDIRIVNNTFKDCGGNAADVGVCLVPATFTSKRWEISGNTFSGSKAPAFRLQWHGHAATDTDPYIDINIHDNIISAPDAANSGPACVMEGMRGVRLERNTFTAWPGQIIRMGYDKTGTVKDISIRGNIIVDGGTTPGYAINFNVGDRVEVADNTMTKNGTVQNAMILVAGTGPTSGLIVRNNVGRNVSALLSFGAGTTTPTTNHSIGNTGFTSTVPDPVTYFGNVDRIGPLPTTTVTTNYVLNRADSVIITNGSSITVTLPDPAAVSKDRKYAVKNINRTALRVVSAGTSKTIDGAASQSLAQWAKGTYISDGTQWLTV